MKISIILLVASLFAVKAKAQDSTFCKFPLNVGLQFQNLALPLEDLGSNFSHPGITVGSELSLGKKHRWLQQLTAGYYLNKGAGNGFSLATQTVYRPNICNHFYFEVKAGVGWLHISHPVEALKFKDGDWTTVGGGKSQVIVPIGISFGYRYQKGNTYICPFIGYQMIPSLFYDDTLPLNFYTVFNLGARIYFKHKSN